MQSHAKIYNQTATLAGVFAGKWLVGEPIPLSPPSCVRWACVTEPISVCQCRHRVGAFFVLVPACHTPLARPRTLYSENIAVRASSFLIAVLPRIFNRPCCSPVAGGEQIVIEGVRSWWLLLLVSARATCLAVLRERLASKLRGLPGAHIYIHALV
jgi:hypothetical protein